MVPESKKKIKIVLVTTSQLATNPRIVKEAKALSEQGYEVVVLYSFQVEWGIEYDLEILKNSKWKALKIGGDPYSNPSKYHLTRIRYKLVEFFSFFFSYKYRVTRIYKELLKHAVNEKANLYIGHNLGALPVVCEASQMNNVKFAFDAEDFHRGEFSPGSKGSKLAKGIEDQYLKHASYISSASPLIGEEYSQLYPNVEVITVNNVFSLNQQPDFLELIDTPEIRLFWFSQKISRTRGLPDVLTAMQSLKNIPIHLTLLGSSSEEEKIYINSFISCENHEIKILNPCSEKELIKISARQHIGLALEGVKPYNRQICLTNKVFTYLLAGNAIIASNTPAQKQFLEHNPGIGRIYQIGDSTELAKFIYEFHIDRQNLLETRRNSWSLARERHNWEKEQTKLLNRIQKLA